MTPAKKIVCALATLILALSLGLSPTRLRAQAQSSAQQAQEPQDPQSAAQQPQPPAAEKASAEKNKSEPAGETKPTGSEPQSIGGELAKETRKAEGEEENANLKYSAMVQRLGKLVGLNVHQAQLLALWLNFAIIVFLVFWLTRKSVPALWRKRAESIQRALEEARTASKDASRRLSDIESRLQQMDVEIGRMQISAEKEAETEEGRILKASEEEMRKVVEAAEQEIAAAAKQARRELSTHTADLAVALARRQINVDSNTDQVLVRNFASKLASKPESKGDGGKDGH